MFISDIRGALFVQLMFRIIMSVLKPCQNEMQMKVSSHLDWNIY